MYGAPQHHSDRVVVGVDELRRLRVDPLHRLLKRGLLLLLHGDLRLHDGVLVRRGEEHRQDLHASDLSELLQPRRLLKNRAIRTQRGNDSEQRESQMHAQRQSYERRRRDRETDIGKETERQRGRETNLELLQHQLPDEKAVLPVLCGEVVTRFFEQRIAGVSHERLQQRGRQ